MNTFGISLQSYHLILNVLKNSKNVNKVVIFGSRAMQTNSNGSDIDLALFGKKIVPKEVLNIKATLNEALPIPYDVDIVHFERIENENLKTHILKEGKTFYNKFIN